MFVIIIWRATVKRTAGFVSPIPTLPVGRIRIRSELFVRITKGLLFAVPNQLAAVAFGLPANNHSVP